MASKATASEEVSKARSIGFRLLLVALAALTGVAFFGIPLLVLGWFASGTDAIHKFHTLGWAALMGILLTVPALAQLRRPEHKIAATQQIALVVVAIILGYAAGGDFDPVSVLVVLAVVASIVALHPARQQFLQVGPVSKVMLAAVGVAAAPLLIYALDQGQLQSTLPNSDPHSAGEHWSDMAKVTFGIVLTGMVAALRAPGSTIPARCAAAAAIVLGAASVMFPNQASSFGTSWGLVAIGGGVAFLALSEWEGRRPAEPTATGADSVDLSPRIQPN